ncbi:GNAT family N-acetyltransferase [Paenibacillus sp. GCM10027626]|uniref:GNAT family N-acetyltransferase n=1 Tax=Paenibacillus sp. GCM10027626 TaxID=3273411 RepID=UPI0036440EE6
MGLRYEWQLPGASDIYALYDHLDWNAYLQLSEEQLFAAMRNSLYSIYVYDGELLVGTGRIVSDGVISAYLCGVGVHEGYRNRGIGAEVVRLLADRCQRNHLHLQLFCQETLVPYYEKLNYRVFGVGMRPE